MNILQFMSDSPFLTFFLACLILSAICAIIRSVVHLIRGYPEGYNENEENEE